MRLHHRAEVGLAVGSDRAGARAGKVGAGAEATPGAGQQDGADGAVAGGARDLLAQRRDQRLAHRIQALRTVQGQGQHAALDGG